MTRNGYSPSFEEIARGMSLKSLATVHKHITNLEKKGLLDRVHNRSRSIDVLPPGSRTRSSLKLPLAGRIAAGLPVEAMETPETISLADVVGNRDVFALEVRGDSMRDEHIINGDYVLVERTKTARQGEIVVALVHGAETTLKRFYPEGNVVRLQPANLEMDPIYRSGGAGGDSGTGAGRVAEVPVRGAASSDARTTVGLSPWEALNLFCTWIAENYLHSAHNVSMNGSPKIRAGLFQERKAASSQTKLFVLTTLPNKSFIINTPGEVIAVQTTENKLLKPKR